MASLGRSWATFAYVRSSRGRMCFKARLDIARIRRSGWSAGTRSSIPTKLNCDDCRSSSPRMVASPRGSFPADCEFPVREIRCIWLARASRLRRCISPCGLPTGPASYEADFSDRTFNSVTCCYLPFPDLQQLNDRCAQLSGVSHRSAVPTFSCFSESILSDL